MKHVLLILAIGLGLGAQAQNPIDEVINSLVKDQDVSRFFRGFCKNESNEEDCDGLRLTSSYEQNSFLMPEEYRARLEKTLDRLRDMRAQAYKFIERMEGDSTHVTSIMVDGWPDNHVSESPDENSIMICFRSAEDSLRRYANLFTWKNMADSIRGNIYRIYGLDPVKGNKRTIRKVVINGQEFNIGTFYPGPITINSNGGQKWIKGFDRVVERKSQQTPDMGSDSVAIANSTDFIREFTRLYTLFGGVRGQDGAAFQNTILNRMDNLVRQHGIKFQMKEECDLCIKMLQAMKREVYASNPKPVKGYIDVIIKRIKKQRLNVPI